MINNPYSSKPSDLMKGAGMPSWSTPFERERKFISSLNIDFIQNALWLLLAVFIMLNFLDTITTLYAAVLGGGFVELNPLGAALFRLGSSGFMLAFLLKLVPTVPLLYIVAFRRGNSDEFQYRLLKYMGFVVLVGADLVFGAIVLGNNLPLLFQLAGTRS